jgi:hypothetical protein
MDQRLRTFLPDLMSTANPRVLGLLELNISSAFLFFFEEPRWISYFNVLKGICNMHPHCPTSLKL